MIKHLELVIRQLEQRDSTEDEKDKAYTLLFKIEDLFEDAFEH